MTRAEAAERSRLRKELESLLSVGPERSRQRAESEFDRASGGKRNIVLFGAGGLGKKMLKGLRLNGLKPVAFSDNNSSLWGNDIDDIPVVAPLEAAERFGDNAVFIVSIWRAGQGHRFENTASHLRSFGCKTVISFLPLMWKYPDTFLPYYCIDRPEVFYPEADRILAAFDLWDDVFSRREYLAQVRFRLLGDISGLPSPLPGEQYFPPDILQVSTNEVFVDCGAFDGDVLKALLRMLPNFTGQVFAFEPDPVNYRKLCHYVESLPENLKEQITVSPLGTGARSQRLRFSPEGEMGSAIDPNGSLSIDIVSLDVFLKDEIAPTFIKMDIEGAEPEALAGAASLISAYHPVLAIGSYHAPDHLWEIPLQIEAMADRYRFFLRPHNEEGWDLVTYAVSPERVLHRY